MKLFVLLLTVTVLTGWVADSQTWAQETDRVVTISPAGESYVDPEILPGGNLITYQAAGNIYLARLNPESGLFATSSGPGLLVDSGAARLLTTFNGPEFGIDANGWALFYAKADGDRIQTWQATLDRTNGVVTERVSDGGSYLSQLVSRNPRAETTRIAAIQGTWQDGTAVWFDESAPDVVTEISAIENGISSVRWVDDTNLITYSERDGANRGQVGLLDTDSGVRRIITDDAGDKTDPYGWFAPEYDNDLLVLTILDNSAVAVYRDTGGAVWERIATLTPPPEARFDFVSSAEPFTLNGRSYMSLVIKEADSNRQRFTDSEVWLFDLHPDPTMRYAERCDSGESDIARSDPEIYVGAEHVFVYYNVLSGPGTTPYEIRRCRSALTVNGTPTPMPIETPLPSTADTSPCLWIAPQTTDSRIDAELEPHYVCEPQSTPQGQLLVFFPGTGADPDDYERFVEEAASGGLHAIGLSYVNPRSINLQICPPDPDPDCHEKARREVITGEDLHPSLDVDATNSITGRLVALLQERHAQAPAAGWDAYFIGDAPRWEHIIVSGHSQGAGMAAFVAHENLVARAILFAWVDLKGGQAVDWVLGPHATPAERVYYFDHVDDRARGAAAKQALFAAFGIDALGAADVDALPPPYGDAHVLITALEPAQTGARPSAGTHNMVVGDDFTPLQNGVPILRDVWRYLLGIA